MDIQVFLFTLALKYFYPCISIVTELDYNKHLIGNLL